MALDVRLYVVLVILCDISNLQRRFYYKLDGEQKMSENWLFETITIHRAVVDLESWIIIAAITAKTSDYSEKANVYVRHYDGFTELKHECNPVSKFRYGCNTLGKYAVIESNSNLLEVKVWILEVRAEHYIGCFKNHSTIKLKETKADLEECHNLCATFYGLNLNGDCFCVESLNELVQVQLSHCTEYFKWIELCGKDVYFAIYWKAKKTIGFSKSSWDCIYELKDCPNCTKGKMGVDCEINDCSDNGNCGDSECQNITLWKFFTFTNCFCTSGFHVGPTQCEDIDECANSSDSCDANTTKCVNNVGSYMCECAPGFKKLNQFECGVLQEREKEGEQDKEQEKEMNQEKYSKAGHSLVYTGTGFAVIALLCITILYIYF